MNKKPPKYPFDKNDYSNEKFKKRIEKLKENHINEDDSHNKDIKFIESLNRKISIFLDSKSIDLTDDEKKKKIGLTITTIIILFLIISAYYFLIYQPSQEELESAKISKLNELHSLFKGPLSSTSEAFTLENKIKNSGNIFEIESIDILGPATKEWQSYQKKSINLNHDPFNRTLANYTSNGTKTIIMSVSDALTLVNENDAKTLSNIKFEKPNTAVVPVRINRLQAGGGLLSIGDIVDVYTKNNKSNNETNPDISSCTVISILRCEDNGEIESEYTKSNTVISGNDTNPNENSKEFKTNVEEMIKGSIAGGYDESSTVTLLNHYGLRLSKYERQINLADLDSEYILLIETPSNKVSYLIENMDEIILTIPTNHAPDWMVNEIKSAYK